jgi:hypothetical protein
MWWTIWAAGARSNTCARSWPTAPSAERQLEVYRKTGDLRAVVQDLVDETRQGVEQSARTYRLS